MKWFGSPWPREDFRASVCEDDADKIPTPVGFDCYLCKHPVEADDNGIALPLYDGGGATATLLYSHKACWLRQITGCSARLRGEPCEHDGDYREDALRVEDWLAVRQG